MKCMTILAVAAVVLTGFCPPETKENLLSSRKNNSSLRAEKPSPSKNEHSSKQVGYDSPEAVVAALEQSIKDKDYSAMVRCFSPAVQEWMVVTQSLMAMICTEILPEEQAKEQLVELMVKHGFNKELELEVSKLPFKTSEDRIAYLNDLFEWIKKTTANSDDSESMFNDMWSMSPGSVGEVKIDGDKATATFTYSDHKTEELNFIRIDGKWFATSQGFE